MRVPCKNEIFYTVTVYDTTELISAEELEIEKRGQNRTE